MIQRFVFVIFFAGVFHLTGVSQTATGRSNVGSLSVATEAVQQPVVKTSWVSVTADLAIPSKNEYLSPTERGRLRVLLTNKWKNEIKGVVATLRPDQAVKDITYNESIVLGDVPGGVTRLAIFYLTASEDVTSQNTSFWIHVRDGQGELVAEPFRLNVVTQARKAR